VGSAETARPETIIGVPFFGSFLGHARNEHIKMIFEYEVLPPTPVAIPAELLFCAAKRVTRKGRPVEIF
jgi:hypothetical protein